MSSSGHMSTVLKYHCLTGTVPLSLVPYVRCWIHQANEHPQSALHPVLQFLPGTALLVLPDFPHNVVPVVHRSTALLGWHSNALRILDKGLLCLDTMNRISRRSDTTLMSPCTTGRIVPPSPLRTGGTIVTTSRIGCTTTLSTTTTWRTLRSPTSSSIREIFTYVQ